MAYHSSEELIFINNHPHMYVGDGQYLPAVMGGADADNVSDIEKVQSFIKEQVEAYVAELDAKRPIPTVTPQPVETDEQRSKRQLTEIIKPITDPDINTARFEAADAKDYIKFYTANPDAVEYQEKVEKTFEALAKAGRPTSRNDILDYLIGQEYRSDRDKFTEKLTVKRKEQLERAESAADLGTMSVNKAKNDPAFAHFMNYEKLSGDDVSTALKEMERVLEGVTF